MSVFVAVKGAVSSVIAKEVCFELSVPEGVQNKKDIDLRKVLVESCRRVDDPAAADFFSYTYDGGTKKLRRGDKLALSDGEYLFASARFPGLFEALPSNVQTANEAEVALTKRVAHLEADLRVAKADLANAEARAGEARTDKVRAEGRADALVVENEKLKAQVDDLATRHKAALEELQKAKDAAAAATGAKTVVDSKTK
jgi:hypothetical protein